ncbi:hypothetical protein ACS0PU_011367 [Formica fusca]
MIEEDSCQLGYRDLTATDNNLQKILIKQIEESDPLNKRKTSFAKLDERS